MPELPEVETTRRGLLQSIGGRRIVKVDQRRPDLRFPIPKDLKKRLENMRITDIRRRAKYLLIDLDSGDVMLAHLGMSGSFVVMPEKGFKLRTHDHVILHIEGGLLAIFNDPRRFGLIDLLKAGEEGAHPLLKHLGPEPLSADFSPEYLAAQLAKRTGPIKPVLMDQKLVVGVGNIYASESLHLCGINPLSPSNQVAKKSKELVPAIQKTLEAAIRSGGSTLRNYVGAGGEGGYFQHHFHVYDRDGEACFSCGEKIQSCVQAGRATYWCEVCQPLMKKRQKR